MKRTKSVRVRLSDAEYADLKRASKALNLSTSDAVRQMAADIATGRQPVRSAAFPEVSPADRALVEASDNLLRETRKIGANVNQIARAFNIAAKGGNLTADAKSIYRALTDAGAAEGGGDALSLLRVVIGSTAVVVKGIDDLRAVLADGN